ncbi:CotO family spore coat protein [Priestia filamentosa]|uniref:CotO family spore coat protein n=1 Tax=Priestia filamentosa TaxID=1402861 RepID=UPI000A0825A4|nr:CotO family spore coat protein [Priestia filamentosa]MDT3765452.1 CotO family spore coat protein [Priestia filamentosa]WCM16510.1 CotO family spore coat protein [Priestia filamentosa]WRU95934.1 CotO family spore coat protein [Priestia filamentosa]SMF53265.1 Spore coat protein CotO [Priestia filamentosa]
MKKFNNEGENTPLMYIVQPEMIEKPKRSMQSVYQNSFFKKVKKTRDEREKVASLSKALEVVQNPLAEKEKEKKENKMFQKMSIEEKAAFLADFPPHLSQPVCQVETKERTYSGTIVKVEDKTLYMINPAKTEQTVVPTSEVKDITILKI